jgi:isochorismate hydrolase
MVEGKLENVIKTAGENQLIITGSKHENMNIHVFVA